MRLHETSSVLESALGRKVPLGVAVDLLARSMDHAQRHGSLPDAEQLETWADEFPRPGRPRRLQIDPLRYANELFERYRAYVEHFHATATLPEATPLPARKFFHFQDFKAWLEFSEEHPDGLTPGSYKPREKLKLPIDESK